MEQSGTWNKNCGLEQHGFDRFGSAHWNMLESELFETAISNGEGRATKHGALAVETGKHTGRSAQDKFVMRDASTEDAVWWDNNKAMEPEAFDRLLSDFKAHAQDRKVYVQDLVGGADADNQIKVRVVTEFAWHALFIRHLLRRPELSEVVDMVPELTIVNLPSFNADPERHGCRTETVIAVNFAKGLVLIGGTEYAGENKKSVFTALNYFLPEKGVMPMHCSANVGDDGDSALFFGLSGTGKTTLSSDPNRTLIGDDEHGWSDNGIFNFEGGCYAKTIRLSAEAEPEIYATTQRQGSVLENVVIDPATGIPDFDDASLTENGRVAYPLHYIPNASETGQATHPRNIIMLTADAFGVLPPIAKMTPSQAMYHFLSGYTAKVAGTEKGVAGTQATFSTCFGAPFMPRHPSVYGNLLKEKIGQYGSSCWLVNTGWTGGAYGTGSRMPIKATRALLTAALNGELDDAEMRNDPNFGFAVPVSVPGVDDKLLDPRQTWDDPEAYDAQAQRLVQMFIENFAKFTSHVDTSVLDAAPVAA
ncbi:MAG: phosphoenolpyruvate carboxykinase [Pseudomonadota bacterium]